MDYIYVFTSISLKEMHYMCNKPSPSTLRHFAPRHGLWSPIIGDGPRSLGMVPDHWGWSPIIGDDPRSLGSSIPAIIAKELQYMKTRLKESIDLVVSYIAEGSMELKLSKAELTQLFTIATVQTYFLLNGKVNDQIDGVAMGSVIAPVLASLFLGHYASLWLNRYKGPPIHFYRRYVDDTFCLLTMNVKLSSSLNFSIHSVIVLNSLWKRKITALWPLLCLNQQYRSCESYSFSLS